MRAEFQADLEIVRDLLVTMAEQLRAAMKRSTSALLESDQTDAEEVVHADVDVDLGYRAVEERVYELLARQAPVAPQAERALGPEGTAPVARHLDLRRAGLLRGRGGGLPPVPRDPAFG